MFSISGHLKLFWFLGETFVNKTFPFHLLPLQLESESKREKERERVREGDRGAERKNNLFYSCRAGRELINGVSKHAKAAQAQFLFIDSIYKKIPTKKTRGTATLKKSFLMYKYTV